MSWRGEFRPQNHAVIEDYERPIPAAFRSSSSGSSKSPAPMRALTAKVFADGNGQALRLPKSLKVRAKTVLITPTNGGFAVTYRAAEAHRRQLLRKLWGSCPNFP